MQSNWWNDSFFFVCVRAFVSFCFGETVRKEESKGRRGERSKEKEPCDAVLDGRTHGREREMGERWAREKKDRAAYACVRVSLRGEERMVRMAMVFEERREEKREEKRANGRRDKRTRLRSRAIACQPFQCLDGAVC